MIKLDKIRLDLLSPKVKSMLEHFLPLELTTEKIIESSVLFEYFDDKLETLSIGDPKRIKLLLAYLYLITKSPDSLRAGDIYNNPEKFFKKCGIYSLKFNLEFAKVLYLVIVSRGNENAAPLPHFHLLHQCLSDPFRGSSYDNFYNVLAFLANQVFSRYAVNLKPLPSTIEKDQLPTMVEQLKKPELQAAVASMFHEEPPLKITSVTRAATTGKKQSMEQLIDRINTTTVDAIHLEAMSQLSSLWFENNSLYNIKFKQKKDLCEFILDKTKSNAPAMILIRLRLVRFLLAINETPEEDVLEAVIKLCEHVSKQADVTGSHEYESYFAEVVKVYCLTRLSDDYPAITYADLGIQHDYELYKSRYATHQSLLSWAWLTAIYNKIPFTDIQTRLEERPTIRP